MSGAGLFSAKVSVFSAMNICEVPLEVWLEDCKFVGHVWVGAEQGCEVEVGDLRLLWFSMEFGASVTQFG